MEDAAALTPAVQCSTGPFWAYELEDALDAVAEAGFTDVELMVTRDPKTHEPDLPARLAEQRGLRIASVHGPFLVLTKSVWGLDPIAKIKRGVEMCRTLGADCLIVHPPYLWEREYARWVTQESAIYSNDSGVTVAVETMFPRWVAGRQMSIHRWIDPKDLFKASSRVVMDTSHVTVARHDIFDAYDVLLPKLVHIHLSNNAGDGRDGHLELAQGVLALDRFLDEVRRTRYAGVISLELSVRKYIEDRKSLVEMLRRSRVFVERKVSGTDRTAKGMPRKG